MQRELLKNRPGEVECQSVPEGVRRPVWVELSERGGEW